MMNVLTLSEGSEIDSRVLGLLPQASRGSSHELYPSRNLQDAFAAAESFGLFSKYDCLLGTEDESYCIFDPLPNGNELSLGPEVNPVLACAPSARLAICRAILRIGEQIHAGQRVER
jgi:hypothetical protein